MISLRAKFTECDKSHVSSMKGIIDMEIKSLDQEKALSDMRIYRDVSVSECDLFSAELTEEQERIKKLETSLEVNKDELKRLARSRKEGDAKKIEMKRSLDAALSCNETFQEV